MNDLIRRRTLTPGRMWAAMAVAIVADGIQMMLGAIGWTFIDEVIDVVAMVLLTLLVGFHPLFLPTFVVELVPVVDMLPTWTACVALVLALRRKQQTPPPVPSQRPPGDVIDV